MSEISRPQPGIAARPTPPVRLAPPLDVESARRAARLERVGERAAFAYTAIVFAFLFLPILVVVVYSFNAGRHVTELTGFSTAWYASAWSDRFLMNALRNSLTIATTTAILAAVMGTASALAMDRLRPRLRWPWSSSPTSRSSSRAS